jgi:hypothetical protein
MAGVIGDVNAPIGIVKHIQAGLESAFKKVSDKANFMKIFGVVFSIFTIVTVMMVFVKDVLLWIIVDIPKWLFDGPWAKLFEFKPGVSLGSGVLLFIIRYIIVIFYKIVSLPKCFLWYFLDTAGWIFYLPFRFIFWLVDWLLKAGIVKAEYKAWDFMDQIDYFVHGRPRDNYFMYQYKPKDKNIDSDGNPLVDGKDPNTLQLGFHIIHFPDSVMYQCYAITPFSLWNFPPFPMKNFKKLMNVKT